MYPAIPKFIIIKGFILEINCPWLVEASFYWKFFIHYTAHSREKQNDHSGRSIQHMIQPNPEGVELAEVF